MIRRFALVLVVLVVLSLGVACDDDGGAGVAECKVTDDLGRAVAIEAVPEKIVSLAPSCTEILFALGVEDKIVGKAAALLLVRLGIRNLRAGVLSELGRDVLKRFHVQYSAGLTVRRIDCQTEILLAEVEDPEQAYRIVAARAGR